MVVHVAGDEHAIDLRAGLVVDDEVACLVDLEPVAEGLRVGAIADRDEQAVERHARLLAGHRVAQPHALHLGRAQDLLDGRVRVDLDLRVGHRPVDHDLRGTERIAAVDQVDLRRESGEERGLLECRVAAAHDRDLTVAEEEPVARGARRHATAAQSSLRVETEPQSRCTGRDDHRLRSVLDPPCPEAERALGEVDPVDVDVDDLAAEARSLGAEGGHQVRALDAIRKPRVVLDVRGEHELAAGCGAGEDDRFEVGPGRVDGRGQPGRTRTHDHQLGIDATLPRPEGRRSTRLGDRRGVAEGLGRIDHRDRQPTEWIELPRLGAVARRLVRHAGIVPCKTYSPGVSNVASSTDIRGDAWRG